MNRLSKALTAALIGLASFTTVVLLAEPSASTPSAPTPSAPTPSAPTPSAPTPSAPTEQPCPVWAAEQGLTDSQSYDQCFNLWNAGYDTRSITWDEYEWNIQDYRHVFGEDA